MFRAEQNPHINRVKFELRATGIKPQQFDPKRSGVHTRGYLPHVKREGARYFVTFRLADSLPKQVLLRLQEERAVRQRAHYAQEEAAGKLGATPPEQGGLDALDRDYFRKVEAGLDKGIGACWMRRPEIADLVADSLRCFDKQRYQLEAWVVMPNHVHVVVWPMPNHTLSSIVQSWKRYTAREANLRLGRTGQAFWQPESFDRWIRNDTGYERCCRYVVNNPVKARFCATAEEWRWSSAWKEPCGLQR
jgi:REP element-mobilizing transposase RayT